MKRSKTSSTRPLAFAISPRTGSSTSDVKTSGRIPVASCASFTCATTSLALATESTKGSVTRTKSMPSNCVMSEDPRASTVRPVPSETKKTRRVVGMGFRGLMQRNNGVARPI